HIVTRSTYKTAAGGAVLGAHRGTTSPVALIAPFLSVGGGSPRKGGRTCDGVTPPLSDPDSTAPDDGDGGSAGFRWSPHPVWVGPGGPVFYLTGKQLFYSNVVKQRCRSEERFDFDTRRMHESRRHHSSRTDLGACGPRATHSGSPDPTSVEPRRKLMMRATSTAAIAASDAIEYWCIQCTVQRLPRFPTAEGPTSTGVQSPLPSPWFKPGHAIGPAVGAPESVRMAEVKLGNSRFKRVCVFCGSSTGKRNCYQDAAVELGKELVARKVDLVYGGGSVGLMGLVSEAVHHGGGHVIGIIPRTLMAKEVVGHFIRSFSLIFHVCKNHFLRLYGDQITGETLGEVKPVASMHQRKAEMARHSDAFIALPGPTALHKTTPPPPFVTHHLSILSPALEFSSGGYGTLEELLEVITWAQLGIHNKPVGLLNVDGYYNSLLAFIDKAVEDGFIQPVQRHIFVSAPTAKDLVQKLEIGRQGDHGRVAKLVLLRCPLGVPVGLPGDDVSKLRWTSGDGHFRPSTVARLVFYLLF
ncbi:hypothetical protein BHE74_00014553, partial [Ensete ventricosum]